MVKYVLHRSIDEHPWEQGIDYKTGSLGRTAETKGWPSEGCELGLLMGIFTSTLIPIYSVIFR